VSYRSLEEWRRTLNGLVFLQSLLDGVFACSIIVESGMRRGGLPVTDAGCSAFAFLTQFSLVGSELCLAALSTDLFSALRNPFVNYKSRMRQ
jgi:hypothetical protein